MRPCPGVRPHSHALRNLGLLKKKSQTRTRGSLMNPAEPSEHGAALSRSAQLARGRSLPWTQGSAAGRSLPGHARLRPSYTRREGGARVKPRPHHQQLYLQSVCPALSCRGQRVAPSPASACRLRL